jgi:hypothetical protein
MLSTLDELIETATNRKERGRYHQNGTSNSSTHNGDYFPPTDGVDGSTATGASTSITGTGTKNEGEFLTRGRDGGYFYSAENSSWYFWFEWYLIFFLCVLIAAALVASLSPSTFPLISNSWLVQAFVDLTVALGERVEALLGWDL